MNINITKLSKNNTVTRDNRLVQARYKLTQIEQKIIYAIISTIKISDKDFSPCIFKVSELAEFCNIGASDSWTSIKEATKALLSRIIVLREDENKEIQTHWVQRATYIKNKGLVEFVIDESLKPYLLELKKAFTSIKIYELLNFKSSYTGRIYELILQYKNIGEREIKIDEFRKYLNIEDVKAYDKFFNIKKRIIESAIEEINNTTTCNVNCTYKKTGRKITAIVFKIKEKKKENQSLNESEKKIVENEQSREELIYKELLKVGLENESKKYSNSSYSIKRIIDNIRYTLDQKNVQNQKSYVTKAIAEDFAEVEEKSLFTDKREKERFLKEEEAKIVNVIQHKKLFSSVEATEEEAKEAFLKWYFETYSIEYKDEIE